MDFLERLGRRRFLSWIGLFAASGGATQAEARGVGRRVPCLPQWRTEPFPNAPPAKQFVQRGAQPRFVQPDYAKWNLLKRGMAESEVIGLLGQPMERETPAALIARWEKEGSTPAEAQQKFEKSKNTLSFLWTYGRLDFSSFAMPITFDFSVSFQRGHVIDVVDPFDGRLSTDDKPTVPQLIQPREGDRFQHYPPFVDIRWQPSSGIYPVKYAVEVEFGQRRDINHPEEGRSWELEYYPHLNLSSDLPYAAVAFIGWAPGRCRVKAINRLGESDWSGWREFAFESHLGEKNGK